MYDANRISIHDSAPSEPAIQGMNHLIRYLAGWPHFPIMYPSGLDVTTTHELRQEVSSGYLHSQNTSNGLFSFADGVEFRASNEKFPIACVILCLFGVSLYWSAKTQPSSVAH